MRFAPSPRRTSVLKPRLHDSKVLKLVFWELAGNPFALLHAPAAKPWQQVAPSGIQGCEAPGDVPAAWLNLRRARQVDGSAELPAARQFNLIYACLFRCAQE